MAHTPVPTVRALRWQCSSPPFHRHRNRGSERPRQWLRGKRPSGVGPGHRPPGRARPSPPLPSRPVPCHRPHQRLRPGTRLTSHPAGQGGKNSSPRWGPAVGLCPEDLPPLALDLPGITSRGGLALSPPPGAGLRPPSLSSDSPPAHRSPYRPEVKPISSPRGPEGGCPAPEASLPLTIFSLAHWTEAAW